MTGWELVGPGSCHEKRHSYIDKHLSFPLFLFLNTQESIWKSREQLRKKMLQRIAKYLD